MNDPKLTREKRKKRDITWPDHVQLRARALRQSQSQNRRFSSTRRFNLGLVSLSNEHWFWEELSFSVPSIRGLIVCLFVLFLKFDWLSTNTCFLSLFCPVRLSHSKDHTRMSMIVVIVVITRPSKRKELWQNLFTSLEGKPKKEKNGTKEPAE